MTPNSPLTNTINMSEMPAALEALIKIGESPCLIGGSGIGKTQVHAQVAAKLGYDLVPVNLLTKDPVALGGFPVVNTKSGYVEFVPVKMFTASKKPKWLFFDELTHAVTMVQSMCYQIFEENRLGDFMLPPDCVKSAAYNRVKDKGVHNRVPNPLRRRFWEFQVVVDDSPAAIDAWCKWAYANDVEDIVIAFIRQFPHMLYQDMIDDELRPDPRAWVKISKLISNNNLTTAVRHKAYVGKVGTGAALEFSAWERLFLDLPVVDGAIMNPKTEKLPTGPAGMYTFSAALAKRATVNNFGNILTYLDRLPEEYNVFGVKLATRKNPSLTTTAPYTRWTVKYSHVTM